MKYFPRILIVVLVVGIAGIAFLFWSLNHPPVDLDKLKTVQVGMSKTEVKEILGKPNQTYDQRQEWAYTWPMSWSIVKVYFDPHDRVISWDYDY